MNYIVWIQNDPRDRRNPHLAGPFWDRESAIAFCQDTNRQPYWSGAWFRVAPIGEWENIENLNIGT